LLFFTPTGMSVTARGMSSASQAGRSQAIKMRKLS
jgi:hypothetical protein